MRILLLTFLFVFTAQAQTLKRDFPLKVNGLVEVKNFFGRVNVSAEETQEDKVSITAQSNIKSFAESEMKTSAANGKVTVEINPIDERSRIDLTIKVPVRSRIRVETRAGEVRLEGDFYSAEADTETGTISTNVSLENLKYDFLWRLSRPRYLSDVPLSEVKERSGGRFTLSGKLTEPAKDKKENILEAPGSTSENTGNDETTDSKDTKNGKKDKKPKDKGQIALNLTTDRGIILLNVNPSEVPSDLRERPLTEAAKAIIRSGDSILMEAIRRTNPKYFGDYAKTLPARKREPTISEKPKDTVSTAKIKQVLVRVADINNRSISGLKKNDFIVTEAGKDREVLAVEPSTAAFNLVLLLDVSGSIENYVNFIRKAARNFINTTSPQDKISIIVFNEDVKQITTFTTDKNKLSESLDTFDAGGGTAYYDAVAYALVDSLRPFRGERTAVVILSDGDDNRSFLPFDALLGSIQESGALIYPLYVPSTLVAASSTNSSSQSLDPLRTRYMGLTSKAEAEGAKLAQISGGVYYPIQRLDELQKAYDDIVLQLRTAYTITYRSTSADATGSPRLKIRTNREGAFVNIGTVVDVPEKEAEKYEKKEVSRDSRVEGRGSRDLSRNTKTLLSQKLNYQISNVGFQISNFKLNTADSRLSTLDSRLENQQVQEITGDVSGIKYKPLLTENLPAIAIETFDVNKSPPSFILNSGKESIAFSRWVSPKRTRSYPYERVYNTLISPKRATIIPILKDEGANGERDFLQFDTVSLMNLLDVYVVLGFYNDAQRDSSDELTDQEFDNTFILQKINELNAFKGTAAEWNLKQLQEISIVAEKAKTAYLEISKKTGVMLHDEKGVDAFVKKMAKGLEDFRAFSRNKSQKAQNREFQTIQPKEALSSDTKGRVTISDKSGGKYFFTCDETKVENKTVYLIEDKHTIRSKMPSQSDIKDGLLKMMVYSNMKNGRVGSESVGIKAVLRLTSNKLEGKISSDGDSKDVLNFFQSNKLTKNQKEFITKLFEEARANNFEIRFEHAEIGV